MTVRAKFTVTSIERRQSAIWNPETKTATPAELQTITLAPVYDNGDPNHENTKFWQASPSGQIQLGTINAAAAAEFELGREYYIDFTPAG